tara:strand:+ start:234 stop:914 length:681 start_codon:yes stop_codon:yes gene_type:complete
MQMKRGKTEVETLQLNGWGVGDLLEGREGNRVSRILITHIGDERFGCKWDYHCNGDFTEERFSTTLSCREWYKVDSAPSGRELNPTNSSLTDSQAREYAHELWQCSDGKPCGSPYCEDCPNQPTPEEDEAFNAMSAKQEQPHEADARMLDAQLAADMAAINPSHYRQGGVECIDALASATINKKGIEAVCVANAIKYLWRYEEKNGVEDVRKAKWYLDRLERALTK